MRNIHVSVGLDLSVQAVAPAIFVLELEVEPNGEHHDKATQGATDSTAGYVEWSVNNQLPSYRRHGG